MTVARMNWQLWKVIKTVQFRTQHKVELRLAGELD
jgi:hypothetical protein